MEKERVLVRDNKGVFLKMFKRKFKDQFDFSEDSFLIKGENESKTYDRSIFVVYDKFELIEFLKLEKKGTNVLVCLFNKQLYGSLAFLEDLNNLVFLDGSKTRAEIIKDLKSHFKMIPSLATLQGAEMKLQTSNMMQTQFHNFYKALFFLM